MHPPAPSLGRRRICGLGAALAAGVAPALAQADLTRLVVAFPPGGPVDFVARAIGDELGRQLGHQVIVENRAGANGAIAAEYVSRAAPDGRTLWLTSVGAVAINPALYEKLPYDPQSDLAPVSLVVRNVEVLVVSANAPFADGAAFVAAARAAGQPLTMASSGTGSVPHLAMELLADAAKVKLLHVPYKGAAPAIADVIAGRVDGFFGDIPGLIGFIRSGRLKPIALAAERRHPLLPQVKTYEEMGVPGVDSDNWYAVFASRNTPQAVVGHVNRALRATLEHAGVKARLMASGAEAAPSTPGELAELLRKDSAKWSAVIRSRKIKAD
ncbi:MAG: tripartite tricarboxylate transporter substrate-binding protein [Xenophilus sp.]